MFSLFNRKNDQLIIDNGKVFCPVRQKDTDIDICAACHRLQEMDPDEKQGTVRCRVESMPLPGVFCG